MGQQGQSATGGWHILAAIAAWLIPGLGHFLLGEKQRGLILGVSIGALWLGGLWVGGVSVCDRTEHPYWFWAQMLTGPSWVADKHLQSLRESELIYASSYEPSFGRVSEQGILYTALAGLLNLLAVIDVIYRDPVHQESSSDEPTPDEPPGTIETSQGRSP